MFSRLKNTLAKSKEFFLFFFLTVVYFISIIFSGKIWLSGDILNSFYGFRLVSVNAFLEQGVFALWNPFIFVGSSLIGNTQTALLHPISILFLWLDPPQYFVLIDFLTVFFAGISMFLLAKGLGMKNETSFFVSVAYMFSSPIITSMFSGHYVQYFFIAFAPLGFLFLKSVLEKPCIKNSVLFSFSLSLLFYSGFMQNLYYEFLALIVFAIAFVFFNKKFSLSQVKYLFFSFVLFILLSLAHFLPMIRYVLTSSRITGLSSNAMTSFSFPLQNIITLFIPNFFGNPATHTFWGAMYYWEFSAFCGALILFIALAGLLINFGKNKYEKIFLLVLIFSFVYALGENTPFFALFSLIPGAELFRAPARFVFIFVLSACVLAGFGLEKLLQLKLSSGKRKFLPVIAILLLVSVLLLFFLKPVVIDVGSDIALEKFVSSPRMDYFLSQIPLVFEQIFMDYFFAVTSVALLLFLLYLKFKRKISGKKVTVILTAFLFINLFIYGSAFIQPKTQEEYFTKTPLIEFFQENSSEYRVLVLDQTIVSDHLLYFYGIEQMLGIESTIDRDFTEYVMKVNRKYEVLNNGVDLNIMILPESDLNILRNLNTKYILSKKELSHKELTLEFEDKDANVLVYSLSGVHKKAFFDSSDSEAEVELKKLNENHYLVKTNNSIKAPLVFSMVYFPGWKVLIDGKEAELLKYENALMMVIVPSGLHEVEFVFESNDFVLGLIISVLSFIVSLYLLFFKKN